jgi:hypothetical protein
MATWQALTHCQRDMVKRDVEVALQFRSILEMGSLLKNRVLSSKTTPTLKPPHQLGSSSLPLSMRLSRRWMFALVHHAAKEERWSSLGSLPQAHFSGK